MPIAINRQTGKKYPVTKDGLKTLQSNPMTKRLFEYQDTEEPPEVTELKKKRSAGSGAAAKKKTETGAKNK